MTAITVIWFSENDSIGFAKEGAVLVRTAL